MCCWHIREEDNLRVLLPQIIEEVEKCNEEYEILVVDTAKPLDNTKGVCQNMAQDTSIRKNRDSEGLSVLRSSMRTRASF